MGGPTGCSTPASVSEGTAREAGFRIELHQKDPNLALATGRQLGVSLPNTATAQELFNACAARGGKAWDHSAMVRALEMMAGFEIGSRPQ